MRVIEAVSKRDAVLVRVHIDEAKTIRDPEQAPPGEGEEDTRTFVPDPEFVMELQWGTDIPQEVIIRETALLAKAESERRGAGMKADAIERANLDAAAISAPPIKRKTATQI